MARLKQDIIEDKANEEMALLVRKYVGDDTYKDVAKVVGMDPSTISYICRGKVKPTIEILYLFGQHPRNGVFFEDLLAVRFPLAVKKYRKEGKYGKDNT